MTNSNIASVVASVAQFHAEKSSAGNVKKARKCERVLTSKSVVEALERISFFGEALANVKASPNIDANASFKSPTIALYAFEKIAQNAHAMACASAELASVDIHTITLVVNAAIIAAHDKRDTVTLSFEACAQAIARVESEYAYTYIRKYGISTATTQRKTSASALALLGLARHDSRAITFDFTNVLLREFCATLLHSSKLRDAAKAYSRYSEALAVIDARHSASIEPSEAQALEPVAAQSEATSEAQSEATSEAQAKPEKKKREKKSK